MAGTTHSPLATVRLLIADTAQPPTLADSQIVGYLDLNAGPAGDTSDPIVIRRAAADALEAIASSETLVSKVIRTQDLATDGTKVAADLRAHAKSLREQADREDSAGIFDVVDTVSCWSGRPEASYGPQVWGL